MKKMLAALLAALLLLSLSAATLAEGRLEAIKAAGKLVVATSPDYAPYEFPGPDGKPVGADMAFAQYIADKLGVELVVESFNFDGVLAAVAAGKIDLGIAGMDPTPDRLSSMDFTDIYYNETNQVILIHKDNAETIKTLADFAGKKVAAQNGTLQQTLVSEQLKDSQMELITQIPDGVMMLLSKKVDGIALASVVAGVFGVVAALAAGFPRFWMRALVALVITTATLFAYVWERSAGSPLVQPAAAEVQPASR